MTHNITERRQPVEYKVLMAARLISEEQLNDMAQQGWRLITIVQWNGQFYLYFSRVVPN